LYIETVATPIQHEDSEIQYHDFAKADSATSYPSPDLQYHPQPYMINHLSPTDLLPEEFVNVYNSLDFDFSDLLVGDINVDMPDIDEAMTPGFAPGTILEEIPARERGEEEAEEEEEEEVDLNIKSPVIDNNVQSEIKPRRAHHTVEKRYRANLNEKIARLDRLVSGEAATPGSDALAEKEGRAQAQSTGKQKVHRQNKTAVLSKAIQYIQILQQDNTKLRDGIDLLRKRAIEARRSLAEEDM